MSKKPNWSEYNTPKLIRLCDDEGYEYIQYSEYHFRIWGATHIIDIWTPRMTYHRVDGEEIKSHEPYPRELEYKFNDRQVEHLLATGEFLVV